MHLHRGIYTVGRNISVALSHLQHNSASSTMDCHIAAVHTEKVQDC